MQMVLMGKMNAEIKNMEIREQIIQKVLDSTWQKKLKRKTTALLDPENLLRP